ncbi:hypothetical protein ACFSTC_58730 [Nonomuraea ferruginea]
MSGESHISGVGAANTSAPVRSTASIPPPRPRRTVRPSGWRAKSSRSSRPLSAASLVLTTRTCEKPSTSAVT